MPLLAGGFDEGEERGRQFHETDGGIGWCIVLLWVSMIGRGNLLRMMSLVEWNISWFFGFGTLSAWERRVFRPCLVSCGCTAKRTHTHKPHTRTHARTIHHTQSGSGRTHTKSFHSPRSPPTPYTQDSYRASTSLRPFLSSARCEIPVHRTRLIHRLLPRHH